VQVAELVEDVQRVLPGLSGSGGIADCLEGVAEIGQNAGRAEAFSELVAECERLSVVGGGLVVVA
jgi:hypothetical protein